MASDISIDSDPDLSHLSESERRIIYDVLKRQKRDDIENDKILRSKQEEKMQEVSPSSTTVERNLMIKSPESIFLGSQQANYGEVCQVCQLTKFADSAGKSCFVCSKKACSRCGFNVEIQENSKKTAKWCCRNCGNKKSDKPEMSLKISRKSHTANIDLTDLDIGIPSPSIPSKLDTEKKNRKQQDREYPRQNSIIDRKKSCPIKLITVEDHLEHKSDHEFFPEEEEEELNVEMNQKINYPYSEISDKLIYSQAQFYCGDVTPLPEKQVKSHFKYINTPMEMSRSPVLVDSGFMYNDGGLNRNDLLVYSNNNSQSFNRNIRPSSSSSLMITDPCRYNLQRELAVSPTTNILVNSKEISVNEFNAESIPYFKSRRDKASSRRKLESLLRNDSLSSDPSEPPSRKIVSPTKLHSHYHNKKMKQNSFSSSEDDLPTSIECTSGDDKELEIDSLSERDINPTNQWLDPSTRKSSRLGQNRSFDKDSGISEGHHREYSSEMVSQLQNTNYKVQGYEDKNNPVTWRPSKDGKRLIGHMILRKFLNETPSIECGSGILGLKVVGGKITVTGQRRAYITKVKPESIADVVGHLLAGDEVIEWNGKSFRGLSNDEVNEIISDSKHEGSVELIVQRNLDVKDTGNPSIHGMKYEVQENYEYSDRNRRYVSSVDQNCIINPSCSIQMRLFYNPIEMEFNVNLLSATNLMSSPYMNCSFFVQLIVGSEKKESTIISDTISPYWDQDFIFKDIRDHYLKSNDLVTTVFYYDHIFHKYSPIAEVIIDLGKADFSNRLYSYPLTLYYDHTDKDIDTPTPIYRSSADSSNHSSSTCNKEMSAISPPPIPERSPKNKSYEKNIDYEGLNNLHIYCESPPMPSSFRNSRMRYDSPVNIESRKIFSPNLMEHNVPSRKSSMQLYKTPMNNCFEYQSSKPYRRSSQGRQHMCYSQRSSSQRRDSVESDRVHHVMPRHCPHEYVSRDYEVDYPRSIESPNNEYRSYSAARFYKTRKGSFQQSDYSEELSSSNKLSLENSFIKSSPGNSKQDLDNFEKCGDPSASHVTDLELIQTLQTSDQDEGPQRLPEMNPDCNRKRRPSIGQKFSSVLRFSRKSNSTSNLEKKARTSFQRSEEVVPAHIKISTESQRAQGVGGNKCESAPISDLNDQYNIFEEEMVRHTNRKSRSSSKPVSKSKISNNQKPSRLNDNQVEVFVEGLGPGQLVGRQVLGMPSLGELQLSFIDKKGHLDIEVIRARGLTPKVNCKVLPQPYVKLYLMEGKNIIEKQKTAISPRRTLDPLYQQQLSFSSEYSGKVLQATVWGEYSRMDKKSFMGRCEVLLDDLDFSSIVFGWYKLYSSIASELPHPVVQTRRLSTSSIGK